MEEFSTLTSGWGLLLGREGEEKLWKAEENKTSAMSVIVTSFLF